MEKIKKQLTYRELKQLFLNFLKQEKIYDKYLSNIKIQKKQYFKTFQNYIDPLTIYPMTVSIQHGHLNLIDSAFIWIKTKEGQDFWKKISDKWSKIISENPLEIIAEKI